MSLRVLRRRFFNMRLVDERLKQGKTAFGKDYFKELLERVRSVRASERRIWQQVTDIFAECSIDYDRNSPVTQDFYAMVQSKCNFCRKALVLQSAEEAFTGCIVRRTAFLWQP